MVNAATTPLEDGLTVRSLTGMGRLETADDGARFDARHAHVEVLVIGAGTSGRAAAAAARAADPGRARPAHRRRPGGDRRRRAGRHDRARRLRPRPRHRRPAPTRCRGRRVGCGGSGPDGSSSPPAPRNARSSSPTATDPGSCSRAPPRPTSVAIGVRPGQRAVIFTTNDTTRDVEAAMREAGVEVVAVLDARRGELVTGHGRRCRRTAGRGPTSDARTVRGRPSAAVRWLEPERRAVDPRPRHAPLRRGDRRLRPGPAATDRADDRGRGRRRRDRGPRRDRARPGSSRPSTATGRATTSIRVATRPSPTWSGRSAPVSSRSSTSSATRRSAPGSSRVAPAGSSPAPSRRPCSARTSGPSGVPTFRPPLVPVSFAQVAGRDRGPVLADPIRVTALHDRHRRRRRRLRGCRPVEAAALLPGRAGRDDG